MCRAADSLKALIIDLAGGHQPMSVRKRQSGLSSTERFIISNLAELEGKGLLFGTVPTRRSSFTGTRSGAWRLGRLNGMFGLAIWDLSNRRLVVACDAMGIKMIYYRLGDGQLTFD